MDTKGFFLARWLDGKNIRKQLLSPLIVAVLVAMLILGVIRFYYSYLDYVVILNSKIDNVSHAVAQIFVLPIWAFYDDSISGLGNTIMDDRNIAYLEIRLNNGEVVFAEKKKGKPYLDTYVIEKIVAIKHNDELLAEASIGISSYYFRESMKADIFNTVVSIIMLLTILTFLINTIARFVTHPLLELQQGVLNITDGNWKHRLSTETGSSEIRDLSLHFNQMTESLEEMMQQRDQAMLELQEANNLLEIKVDQRTEELMASNEELLALNDQLMVTLERLQMAEHQLLQSEKMALLGNLVAGIAHEVNTPLGVCITAISHFAKLREEFIEKLRSNNLKKSDMQTLLDDSEMAVDIITYNLDRASKLIQSFKHVSADQASEEKREFELKKYLDEIVYSLGPVLKNIPVKIEVECEDNLIINSYPGAISQIITNLVMNSLMHAFTFGENGKISMSTALNGDMLELKYSDDGIGMEPDMLKHVFEPFYTTRREQGGTGLGLYVVYNIITMKLDGTINCSSKLGEGTTFLISLPIRSEA